MLQHPVRLTMNVLAAQSENLAKEMKTKVAELNKFVKHKPRVQLLR